MCHPPPRFPKSLAIHGQTEQFDVEDDKSDDRVELSRWDVPGLGNIGSILLANRVCNLINYFRRSGGSGIVCIPGGAWTVTPRAGIVAPGQCLGRRKAGLWIKRRLLRSPAAALQYTDLLLRPHRRPSMDRGSGLYLALRGMDSGMRPAGSGCHRHRPRTMAIRESLDHPLLGRLTHPTRRP
jgi:hypothetical protein